MQTTLVQKPSCQTGDTYFITFECTVFKEAMLSAARNQFLKQAPSAHFYYAGSLCENV